MVTLGCYSEEEVFTKLTEVEERDSPSPLLLRIAVFKPILENCGHQNRICFEMYIFLKGTGF